MRFPVADAHCDFLYGVLNDGYSIRERKRAQAVALPELAAGGVALQFFAAWIDTTLRASPLHQCIAMIDAFERMLAESDMLVRFTPDFLPGQGKIACVLTVEGGEACEGSLAALRTLYRLGVRAMTLTWNENNELAGAALARGNRGLTPLGREMLDEMHRLGMAIDVSHLSDRATDDVLSHVKVPVFASHSNARALCASPRCLSDTHIRRIAERGGVVCVNFYYKQLVERGEACIDDIVRHVCHVANTGGVDCCAFGSDFDGMQQYPRDLKTPRDHPALLRALSQAGFSDSQIERIAYWNLHRYIARFV